ncbi:MAG: hypothetical protein EOP11_10545, partial [Proteobacteria bacterium]
MSRIFIKFALTLFALSANAHAVGETPASFTLDGTLYDSPAGTHVLRDASANIRVQILPPSGPCILYDEQQTVDTSNSEGAFSIQVGSTVGSSRRVGGSDSANSMANVYQNKNSISGNANGCTYSPLAGDARRVRVIVTSTSGTPDVLTPDMVLSSVPSALVAETLQGVGRGGFLQLGAGSLTQSNAENIFSSTNYPTLTSLLAGGSPSSSGGYAINAGTGGSGGIDFNVNGSTKVAIANNGNFSVDNGSFFVNATTNRVGIGTTTPGASLDLGTQSDAVILPNGTTAQRPSPASAGMIRFNATSAKLEFHNGTAWADLGADIAGIAAGGDLSGTYPNPSVGKIRGQTVSADASLDGQVMRYDGTNYTPGFVAMADLRSRTTGAAALTSSCSAAQTLTWNSVTDTLSCTAIGGLDAGVIASGTIAAARLPAEATFWDTATGGINYAGGNIGIGSTAPTTKLDVAGTLKVTGNVSVTAATPSTSTTTGAAVITGGLGVGGQAYATRFNSVGGLFTSGNVGNAYAPTGSVAWPYSGANLGTTIGINNTQSADGAGSFQYLSARNLATNTQYAYMGAISTAGAGAYSPSIVFGQQTAASAYAERVRIDENGNLGINNASPLDKLDIAGGNARIANGYYYRAARNTGGAVINVLGFDSGSDNLYLRTGGASLGSSLYIRNSANADNVTFRNDGNVGIGIAAPTAALHLRASTGATGTSPLKFASGTLLSSPENGTMEYDGTNYYLTAGGTRVAIPLSGGTGSFNTVNAGAGTAAAPSLAFSGDSDTGIYSSAANTIGLAAGGVKVFEVSSAGIASPTTGGAAITTAAGSATAPTYSFAGDLGTGWFNPSAGVLAASTAGTERLRVSSTGLSIGTTASNYYLALEGSVARSIGLERSTGTSGQTLTLQAGAGNNTGGNDRNGGTLQLNGGTATGCGSSSINFAVAGSGSCGTSVDSTPTTKMILNYQGRIGLGVTGPTGIIGITGQVNQSITTERNSTANTAGSDFTVKVGGATLAATDKAGGNLYLGSGLATGTGSSNIYLQTSTAQGSTNTTDNALTTKMAILGSGNVGIGTTAPSNDLSFGGDANRAIAIDRTTTNGAGRYLSIAAGSALGTDFSGGDLFLSSGTSTGTGGSGIQFKTATPSTTGAAQNAPSTKMIIAANGNVGIGVANATAPLHVNSNATTVGNPASTGTAQSSGQVARFAHGGAPAVVLDVGSSSTTGFWFQTSNGGALGTSYPIKLNPNGGNVGIGSNAAPVVALDVAGAVRAGSSVSVTACGSGVANGEGSQRYNYTSHNMEYCNGTSWVALAAPAGQ